MTAPGTQEPVTFESNTSRRATIVGLVMFGFVAVLGLVGCVASFVLGDDVGVLLGALFGIGFSLLAIEVSTFRAHQVLDPARREVRETRRSALYVKTSTHSLDDFERVQLCRDVYLGAAMFHLSLEGRARVNLLGNDRDPRKLVPIGERTARQLGLAFNAEPLSELTRTRNKSRT